MYDMLCVGSVRVVELYILCTYSWGQLVCNASAMHGMLFYVGLYDRLMSTCSLFPTHTHTHTHTPYSGASFSSDTGELIGTQEGLFFQEEVPPHPADVPVSLPSSLPETLSIHNTSELLFPKHIFIDMLYV